MDSHTSSAVAGRPRYAATPLPPYSYVPGHTPHPVSDPAGHCYGRPETSAPALDPADWCESDAYCFGVDLFNHGYYWEAHEAWEGLWLTAGRRGPVGDWLKALIKLAAAAVKAREGNPRGVERHARRAMELVDLAVAQLPDSKGSDPDQPNHYCGLSVALVEAIARGLACEAAMRFRDPQPELVLESWLPLDESSHHAPRDEPRLQDPSRGA